MPEDLSKIIRLITSKGKDEFVSSLREELDDRLYTGMANSYISIAESLYLEEKEQLKESAIALKEVDIPKQEKPVVALISSLQESIRDEKTIVHDFMNGESVTITHEDSRCLVNLHDSLNRVNQEKMRRLMSESYSEYNKILQFSRKHIERTLK